MKPKKEDGRGGGGVTKGRDREENVWIGTTEIYEIKLRGKKILIH